MPSPQISKKKLKAIVFTDMADFTTISAQDENKALDLIQKQNDIIKPIVEKHNGEWLKELGGVETIHQQNEKKSQLLYSVVDSSDFYSNNVAERFRSRMNVPFFTPSLELDKLFIQEAYNQNLLALKGHRWVGGMRASIYNAMSMEGVEALVSFMRDFEKSSS